MFRFDISVCKLSYFSITFILLPLFVLATKMGFYADMAQTTK